MAENESVSQFLDRFRILALTENPRSLWEESRLQHSCATGRDDFVFAAVEALPDNVISAVAEALFPFPLLRNDGKSCRTAVSCMGHLRKAANSWNTTPAAMCLLFDEAAWSRAGALSLCALRDRNPNLALKDVHDEFLKAQAQRKAATETLKLAIGILDNGVWVPDRPRRGPRRSERPTHADQDGATTHIRNASGRSSARRAGDLSLSAANSEAAEPSRDALAPAPSSGLRQGSEQSTNSRANQPEPNSHILDDEHVCTILALLSQFRPSTIAIKKWWPSEDRAITTSKDVYAAGVSSFVSSNGGLLLLPLRISQYRALAAIERSDAGTARIDLYGFPPEKAEEAEQLLEQFIRDFLHPHGIHMEVTSQRLPSAPTPPSSSGAAILIAAAHVVAGVILPPCVDHSLWQSILQAMLINEEDGASPAALPLPTAARLEPFTPSPMSLPVQTPPAPLFSPTAPDDFFRSREAAKTYYMDFCKKLSNSDMLSGCSYCLVKVLSRKTRGRRIGCAVLFGEFERLW
ncbi:hypothetical protein NKR23_g12257 [Pleurostoma richardsiae]|uniref:Uncharacterized protein n=1 Tax=Pleurostoma richardsiae TaxID=41990 RepID=A0AA38R248_9PEZI|nr:hypothetical protein NKR23_g12257 [Pleurostoma richardsiae]